MATIYRKTVTRPLPANAEIITRKGTQVAKWKDRKGKIRTAPLTTGKNGLQRIRTEAATWTAKYRDGEGVVREVATGCRDKGAAHSVLSDLMERSELVKAKVMSPDQDQIADHQQMPLADHVAAYVDHLRDRGVHPDRIKTTRTRITQSADGCEFRWLSELNVDRLEKWLGELTEEPADDETPAKRVSASVVISKPKLFGIAARNRVKNRPPLPTGLALSIKFSAFNFFKAV
jgi:hypothetical protein